MMNTIAKLKITICFGCIKIEKFNDDLESVLNYSSEELASEVHHNPILNLLELNLEEYQDGMPKQYHSFAFFNKLNQAFPNQIQVTSLSMKICRNYCMHHEEIFPILKFLKPGYLKHIKIVYWNDSHMPQPPISRLNNLGFAELEQWRQAEELDIRGAPGFSFMPSCMAHFKVIRKTRLSETDLIHLKQAFVTNPSLSPCTVIAENMPRVPLTTTLKSYIPDDTPDGPARFQIAGNNLAVLIDIRENGVTVRIEKNEAVY